MRLTYKVQVRAPQISSLRRHAPEHLHRALRKTLAAMEVTAKTQAPVDTGALRASLHMVLWNWTDRENANSLAQMLASRKGKAIALAPPRRARTPFEGWLSTAVHYASYQEKLRFFMKAATAEGQRQLERNIRAAIRDAGRMGS